MFLDEGRLASLGMEKEAQRQPDYRAIAEARQIKQKEAFEAEKAAVKRRLASMSVSTPQQQPVRARGSPVQAPANPAEPATAAAIAQAGAVAEQQRTESALDAGKRAREEWEAAKRRVEQLERDLEDGREARIKLEEAPLTPAAATPTLFNASEFLAMYNKGSGIDGSGDGARAKGAGPAAKSQPISETQLVSEFSAQFARERADAAQKAAARREAVRRQSEQDVAEQTAEETAAAERTRAAKERAEETARTQAADAAAAAQAAASAERERAAAAAKEASLRRAAEEQERARHEELARQQREAAAKRERQRRQEEEDRILIRDAERRAAQASAARAQAEAARQNSERLARQEHTARQQRNAQRLGQRPSFTTPGYGARVKARMQVDNVYRREAVAWEARRNEIERTLHGALTHAHGDLLEAGAWRSQAYHTISPRLDVRALLSRLRILYQVTMRSHMIHSLENTHD